LLLLPMMIFTMPIPSITWSASLNVVPMPIPSRAWSASLQIFIIIPDRAWTAIFPLCSMCQLWHLVAWAALLPCCSLPLPVLFPAFVLIAQVPMQVCLHWHLVLTVLIPAFVLIAQDPMQVCLHWHLLSFQIPCRCAFTGIFCPSSADSCICADCTRSHTVQCLSLLSRDASCICAGCTRSPAGVPSLASFVLNADSCICADCTRSHAGVPC